VFNVASYDKGKRTYFNQHEQNFFCGYMDLNPVPWLDDEFKLKSTIPEMVELAKGYSLLNKDVPREGVVVRNYPNNVSFKIVSTDFLLKYGE